VEHRSRWALLAAIAVAGMAVCGFLAERRFFHDDAYISLRYAANLLGTGQLAWNRDEWVEGYTNFLHLLLTAGIGRLGVALPAAAQAINAIAYAALGGLFYWFARRQALPPLAIAAGMLLIGNWAMIAWVYGGLEAPLAAAWAMLCFVAVLPAWNRTRSTPGEALLAGLAAALAVLTRPDLAVLGAVAGASLLVQAGPIAERARRVALYSVLPIVLVGGHALWRYHVYGDWVPNTAYTKADGVSGARLWSGLLYAAGALATPPFAGIFAGVAAVLLWRRGWRAHRHLATCLVAGIAAYTLVVVWVGGDHMPRLRFFVPILPLATMLVAAAFGVLPGARGAPLALAGALVGAGLLQPLVLRPLPMDAAAFVGTIVGRHIHAAWPAGSLVALHTAGATPYFNPDMSFIDMLGLTDRHIARRKVGEPRLPRQRLPGHAKGDGAYVLSRQPDYIILGPAEGTAPEKPWFLSDLELGELPEFRRCYVARTVPIPYDPGFAKLGPPRPNPLPFHYFQRIC